MEAGNQSEKDIFARALQFTEAGPRAAFLEGACGEDTELRQRIEALLAAHEESGDFLKEPHAAISAKTLLISTDSAHLAERSGDKIGRYKLREQIGEGGCGVVYVADQEEPVRRRVALKVIKLGMDTKQVVARFEAERQALALMDHLNIAKVFDAGATETGRPFFVMELVRGIKITDYCDKNNLSTEERLKLFTQVCSAVQHAHQKGIIHRDIKPSNILVTLHDGVPVPKVIDFGIAKATSDQRLTDKTIYTAFEQFIGTPAYMSPEQAEMSGLDIDTRSDIYSLGVLLYELLTSRTPFDAATLLKAGLEQMRRIIREQEPQRPSARLSTLEAADLTTIATHRRAEPPKLLSILRGDLDWIVMKALEKDRTRRYETASALATDIQRHLSNETIIARPPSASYRVQKFLRRNKAALGLASAILFLATALLVITFLLLKEFQLGKYTGISINSNPQGAEVWHGGEMLGYTPFVKKGLPPGEFTYVLVLAKFETSSNSTILLPKLHMNDITFLRPVGHGGTETAAGSSTNVTEIAAPVSLSASIVMIQGSVEFSTKESSRWVIAQTDMVLGPGSQLRTASNSLAKLRFEKSTITINENSVLEIPVQGTNNIDGSKSIIIRTKGAVAAIRG